MKFLVIFLLFIGLFADDNYHSEKHINKELSHLNLSKEQNKKIKKILKKFRIQLKIYGELKEDIEEKREKIFSKNILNIEELSKLNLILDTKAHNIENNLLMQIHEILNKKQRKRFIYYFDDWEVE